MPYFVRLGRSDPLRWIATSTPLIAGDANVLFAVNN
jgi:hypothetical protein